MAKDKEDVIEGEILDEVKVAELAIRTEAVQQNVLVMSREQMTPVLAAFADGRNCFKAWLLSQFIQGKHFGFPPGCEAEYDANGNLMVHTRGGKRPYPVTQWRPKPTLYKTGIKLACELFGIVALLEHDKETQEIFGTAPGVVCIKCTLYNARDTERKFPLGRGRGVAELATTQRQDRHACLLKAQTRAERDAIFDAKPILADLFGDDGMPTERTASGAQTPGQEADAPAGDKDKRALRDRVKGYIRKVQAAEPLDANALISSVVADQLGKTTIDTLKELAQVEAAIMDGEYDAETGNRIPAEVLGKTGADAEPTEPSHAED